MYVGMHEHINSFSMTAAIRLMNEGGLRVQYAEEQVLDAGWSVMNMLCLLARADERIEDRT